MAEKKQYKKLNKKQEAQLKEYRVEWLNYGLCTDPCDVPAATEAMKKAYRLAGLKEPTHFFHVRSPMEAIKFIQSKDMVKLLGEKKTKGEILNQMIYGSFDAYWLAFYAFFRDVMKVEDCKKLDGLIDLAKVCGWANIYEDVVVLQDRPEIISFDEQDRLHSAVGPALKYRDGYSIYMWHNTRIPGEWIETPDKLDPETALTWRQAEQRRCAIEILGWTKILKAPSLKTKVVDTDADPQIGQLLEVTLPNLGKNRFLKVLCGTGREFVLPVPPTMKTALEAQSWTWNLSDKDFMPPEVRT